MSEVTPVADQMPEEVYSIEEIIKIFYFSGITTFGLWEDLFKKLTELFIENTDLAIFKLYEQLNSIINSYKNELSSEINSQLKMIQLQKYIFSLDELMNHIKSLSEDFSIKSYKKNIVLAFKSKILSVLPTTNDNVTEKSEDEDSDNNDSDDEFSKIFDSITDDSKKKRKEKKAIPQVIQIFSNDKQKILTTPGEWGSHLVKIELTDTRDLKGVPKNDHWKKIGQKAVFLIKSSDDDNLKILNKILHEAGKNIASTPGVKKEIKKIYRNRPY